MSYKLDKKLILAQHLCVNHPSQPITGFCLYCKTNFCKECQFLHKKHLYVLLSKTPIPIQELYLKDFNLPIVDYIINFEKNIPEIKTFNQNLFQTIIRTLSNYTIKTNFSQTLQNFILKTLNLFTEIDFELVFTKDLETIKQEINSQIVELNKLLLPTDIQNYLEKTDYRTQIDYIDIFNKYGKKLIGFNGKFAYSCKLLNDEIAIKQINLHTIDFHNTRIIHVKNKLEYEFSYEYVTINNAILIIIGNEYSSEFNVQLYDSETEDLKTEMKIKNI